MQYEELVFEPPTDTCKKQEDEEMYPDDLSTLDGFSEAGTWDPMTQLYYSNAGTDIDLEF